MRYQDGTRPASEARALPAAERAWLEAAMRSAMVDLGRRMEDVTAALAAPLDDVEGGADEGGDEGRAALAERERLLDELLELVESIDAARDLARAGGLPMLLRLMAPAAPPSLRARAAEVAATCCQNNPEVQAAFVEGGALPALWALAGEGGAGAAAAEVRLKGLLALSCMVRGDAAALDWFAAAGGAARLVELAARPEPRLQRKCLQVLAHVLGRAGGPAGARAAACAAAPLVSRLAELLGSSDADLRAAALEVAAALAADPASASALRESGAARGALRALESQLDALPKEEWDAAREEADAAQRVRRALDGRGGAPEAAAAERPPPSAELPPLLGAP
jgi:hsp70-interacting protein